MVAESLTRQHQLIMEINDREWLKNPAGWDGYTLILAKKVGGGGLHFERQLLPGERLKWYERLFGHSTVLAVDTRPARFFTIEKQFVTQERSCEVGLKANIRYRVTNPRVVALEIFDSLGRLHDKVIARLIHFLAQYSEINITPKLIENIICGIGRVPELGLRVDGAEIIDFVPHAQLLKKERLHLLKEHGDLTREIFTASAEREKEILKARLTEIKPAIQRYIEQQKEIDDPVDPEMILEWLDLASSAPRPWTENLMSGTQPSKTNGYIKTLPSAE
jgi:hypothetical protein